MNREKFPLARIERLLNMVYVEPDMFNSAEEFERSHHGDLARLPLAAIDAERLLCRFRWAVLVYRRAEVSQWLEERLHHLDQAAARLRQGARR